MIDESLISAHNGTNFVIEKVTKKDENDNDYTISEFKYKQDVIHNKFNSVKEAQVYIGECDGCSHFNESKNQITDVTWGDVLYLGLYMGLTPEYIYSNKTHSIDVVESDQEIIDYVTWLNNSINIVCNDEWSYATLKKYDIIINATSLGLKNGKDFDFDFVNTKKNLIYIDTIYNPLETKTYKFLMEEGRKVFNGLDMFVAFAPCLFEVFTHMLCILIVRVEEVVDCRFSVEELLRLHLNVAVGGGVAIGCRAGRDFRVDLVVGHFVWILFCALFCIIIFFFIFYNYVLIGYYFNSSIIIINYY